jgi:hypothetical protein
MFMYAKHQLLPARAAGTERDSDRTEIGKTGGSRRKFADAGNHIINLHKPHPGNILKHYQLKEAVTSLKEKGVIKDD